MERYLRLIIWSLAIFSCTAFELNSNILYEKNVLQIAKEISSRYPDVVNNAIREIWKEVYPDVDVKDIPVASDVFAAKDEIYCETCSRIVGNLTDFLRPLTYGITERVLIGVCSAIVTVLGGQPEPLCTGTIKLQLPVVRDVLRSSTPSVSDQQFCEFLNLCIPPNVASTVISAAERKDAVKVSKKVVTRIDRVVENHRHQRSMFAESNAIKVVQLTDIHVEPYYEVNSPTDCGLPVCCQTRWGGTGKAGALGELTCNIPQSTLELFLAKVDVMNPDIIFFSGDAPPHTVWDESYQSQLNCTRSLVDSITRQFAAGRRRLYPVIGNHEMYPTNVFSMSKMLDTQNYIPAYADLWRPVANFDEEQMSTIREGGYYSIVVRPGLRVLTFNSNYMYTFNWYNVINHNAASGSQEVQKMKQFMVDTLKNATDSGEKVILIGHHPPGGSDYIVTGGSRWYQELVRNYSNVIVLQPTGHTHYDEFRLINNSLGKPVSMVYVSPSMDSHGMKNPSMRLYYLNETTYEVLDYEQHYLNIIKVKATGALSVDDTDMIKLLYSARAEYLLDDLSPKSWLDLLNRFRTDKTLFLYHRSHTDANAQADLFYQVCNNRCFEKHICRMLHADYDLYDQCVAAIPPTVRDNSTTVPPPTIGLPGSSTTVLWQAWIGALCIILSTSWMIE